MGGARFKPDIHNIHDLFISRRITFGAEEARRCTRLIPGIRALGTEGFHHAFDDSRIAQRFARLLAHKYRDRHAPGALAADAPIGPRRHHGPDAIAPRLRHEMRLGNGIQRFGADRIGIIHGDEPLRRRAENHGLLGPPAMRIAMRELTRRGERPRCLHRRINGCMRLEDMQALKPRRVMGEGAVIIHGFRDRQVMCAAQIEVILAMARRDMHEPCAGFGGDEIAGQQRHIEFIAMPAQRMRGQRAGKLRTLDHALDAMRANAGILFKLRQQGQRDQQPIPNFQIRFFSQAFDMQKRVVNFSTISHRAIARHGPGRGGPDHHIRANQIRSPGFQDTEFRMQRRADMIVIFNLRFRQRGFLNRAPHHGAQPAIERPIHQKLADLPGNRGF